MGLNLRQMICSGAAIAVAVAVYLGLTPLLGHETAGWVCIVAAAPIAAAGFFTYDCLTFEKVPACCNRQHSYQKRLAAMEN